MNISIDILLVDDSKTNRLIGQKIIEKLGANVSLAETGEQAISMCRENRFHLILMDIEMPGLSGIETAAILRHEKISFAPIFAISGHDSQQTLDSCHAALMTGFLSKPLKQEKIASIIERLFNT